MTSWIHPADRPSVVAHRGSRQRAPENTLAAFRMACEDGADAIEFDVQFTRDGVPVVIHDRLLDRTTGGHGEVERHTYRELRRLSAGMWFRREFSSERIPSLEEALALLAGRTGINIEIKTSGRDRASRVPAAHEILQLVRQHHHGPPILISSFDHRMLGNIRKISAGQPIGILYNPLRHFGKSPGTLAGKVGAVCFFCATGALTLRRARNAREHHLELGVFTVNTAPRCDAAIASGARILFSDCPDILLHHFR
jgi:glycerophosphoryl diester phosphodiesterase